MNRPSACDESDIDPSHPEKRRTRALSLSLVDLANSVRQSPHTVFDVVIVGSGYGGSVAAQQLAGLRKELAKGGDFESIKVCVLERGNEYLPGMFPSSFAELPGHVRLRAPTTGRVVSKHEGLFDLRPGKDVSTLVANGLGGGSLINAGVLMKPQFQQFNSRMPDAVVRELEASYLAQAHQLLLGGAPGGGNTILRGPNFNPQLPPKYHRLCELANRQSPPLPQQAADITVAMLPQPSSSDSVSLSACNGCGDCMTGCNVGAKASLDTNLLAQAQRDGVQIYTGASVLALARGPDVGQDGGHWVLEVVHTSPALRQREAQPLQLRARKVILAAGSLGSTEILLRSRSDKLVFSNLLGERFSGNGDNIAAIHRLSQPAHSSADEHVALSERGVGPTITNSIEVPPGSHGESGFLVQEFAVPGPLKRLFSEMVTTSVSISDLTQSDPHKHGGEAPNATDPCAIDERAMEHTLLVGLIGHDDASGALRLPVEIDHRHRGKPGAPRHGNAQAGSLEIVWPQARDGKHLDDAHRRLTSFCAVAFPGAKVIPNPMWRLLPPPVARMFGLPRGPILTVHPLGGCPMGEDASNGVVDHCGRVFNLDRGNKDDWTGSLVVLDGSILPGSLGANPALTISALALRAIRTLVTQWQYLDRQVTRTPLTRPRFADPAPSTTVIPKSTQIEVIERLWGPARMHVGLSFPETCVVELTLHYQAVDVLPLIKSWGGRVLRVAPATTPGSGSYLRVFRADVWQQQNLRVQDDATKDEYAAWKTNLSGSLSFFHREPSLPFWRRLRALSAFVRNRGLRDAWQALAKCLDGLLHPQALTPAREGAQNCPLSSAKILWHMASRAGEVRRFDYDLRVEAPTLLGAAKPGETFDVTGQSPTIRGHKRLTYNRRANPWRQLTELTLTQMPFMPKGSQAVLKLDTRFIANHGVALVRLAQQENQPNALLDMASFALLMARVVGNIHALTFRQPDTGPTTPPQRLPGALQGLPKPEVTELLVARRFKQANAVVRLTRYPRVNSELAPLVMIHGYSVSGTTFAHPSLQPSAAEFFWRQGRDVWLVDLRTSAGMPTATLPWSYEEVALVDIPAALLHIKTATGQRVDVLAHCIGAAMFSMALLTKAQEVSQGKTQLGRDTWITDAQLGTLSAFNGDGQRGATHPTVRSLVLSQKGPLLRYTDGNSFRAYVLRSLRRWLVPDSYQFRPPENPNVSDVLLDCLLSSMPYPDEDYDMENPMWPCARTPWTGTRHRMDALYARDFSAKNLRKETLHAIDDLFGPINLDTVAQTIHFVRFNCITSQHGRSEFVTLDRLVQRWRGIPTFAIHGADNGLVHVSTQDLLKANFDAAGVAFKNKTYPGLGHQDVLIGATSEGVFQDIEEFLRHPPPEPALPPSRSSWVFAQPWIGPRIDPCQEVTRVQALSTPKFGKALLVLVPVNSAPDGRAPFTPKRCAALPQTSKVGDSSGWLWLDPIPSGSPSGVQGWLALIAYPAGQTTLTGEVSGQGGQQGTGAPPANMVTFPVPMLNAANGAQDRRSPPALPAPSDPSPEDPALTLTLNSALSSWLVDNTTDLTDAFIAAIDANGLGRDADLGFCFALGSCQYPGNLLDKPLALRSLQRLAETLNSEKRPAFVVFTGDQIYADATAGLADPTRSDERYDLPYEAALRLAPMRQIMRRTRVHMMLDDHEIMDSWEPPHRKQASQSRQAFRLRRQALQAYWMYQRMEGHHLVRGFDLSYTFDHGCASFYMLDTRAQRQHRKPGDPWQANMLTPEELTRLTNWLTQTPSRLKFIVCPAMLLPRRLGMLNCGQDQASHSDTWEGYPSTARTLFDLIVDNNIDHTVFLSGDEHLSCVAIATLFKPGKAPRKIVSIHASGLYAPLPFSNSKEEDFIRETDHFKLGEVTCVANTSFLPAGDAFARVCVASTGSGPIASVSFNQAGRDTDFYNLFESPTPEVQ